MRECLADDRSGTLQPRVAELVSKNRSLPRWGCIINHPASERTRESATADRDDLIVTPPPLAKAAPVVLCLPMTEKRGLTSSLTLSCYPLHACCLGHCTMERAASNENEARKLGTIMEGGHSLARFCLREREVRYTTLKAPNVVVCPIAFEKGC